ncbi:MAG TPA: cytochrome c [Edaphobacter sp.]|nr:cytochrome c [Edaphobacter sp.]
MKAHALAVLMASATVFAQGQQAPSPAEPGNPAPHGAQTFKESGCPQCHTIQHSGGTKGPNLSAVGSRLKEDQIRTQITKGGKEMPAFGKVLEPSEIDDLVAYLSSLKGDPKSEGKQ